MFEYLKEGILPFFNNAAPPQEKRESVSLQEAFMLFDDLADTPDIAFGYADDGCYARAHLMCREMQKQGITPKKAWAFETTEMLNFRSPEGKVFRWWYHVAAAVTVQMPDGQMQDMVIDPGMFDGPVTLKEWGDAMHADASALSIVDFGKPAPGHTGDYGPSEATSDKTDKKAAQTMKTYKDFQGKKPRIVLCSQLRQQTMQQGQSFKLSRQGKSWQTQQAPPAATTTQPASGMTT